MIQYSYKQHNWLAYYINNKSFLSVAHLIKGTVLDFGCGERPFKQEIEKRSFISFGVDWPSTLHMKNEIDVYADLSKGIPFKNESVDTILSFQVMEHLPEPSFFLQESNRILSKGGNLILTTPFMWGIHEAPHDYYRYTEYGLKYLLQKAGFQHADIVPNTGYWAMSALRFTYHFNRYTKASIKRVLTPLFFIVQKAALILDRHDFNSADAASYTAVALK